MATQKIALALCIALAACAVFGAVTTSLAPALGTIPTNIVLVAVGDIMLDRTVREKIDFFGADYPFENVRDIFSGADIAVGNLEGGFTDNPSVSVTDHGILHFTFDPALVGELKKLGFLALSLANNHAFDFGVAGYNSTTRYFDVAHIAYFGSPSNDVNLSTVLDAQGKKIAFVGYHQFYSPSVRPIVDEIQALRETSDFIIVYPHWGVEYEQGYVASQQVMAHAFIDAGADAVIGAHPHVIEPVEIYKGKAIFYSLGNFIFDQDFSTATRQGLTLRLNLRDGSVSYELVPVTMRHSKLAMPSAEERLAILGALADSSDVSQEVKQAVRGGGFTLPVTLGRGERL